MIGVIGGSGLYDLSAMTDVRERIMETPFGAPSDAYVCGKLNGCEVAFLPRHGRGHRILPSELNHRANIMGFKLMGADAVIAVTAVGSLREELRPRDIVLPDQYYDRTKASQQHTFFGDGIAAHIGFSEPVCPALHKNLAQTAAEVVAAQNPPVDVRIHTEGTYVNMEGPAFSTKAESRLYRQWGFDLIGMTSLAEAKLCREAEICYQPVCMVTDYDCWHESREPVTVDMVMGHVKANSLLARSIVAAGVAAIDAKRSCTCRNALQYAIMTSPEVISAEKRQKLKALIGRYVDPVD